MTDTRQVIIVRKNAKIKRGELAASVAKAAMKFLTENNEAEDAMGLAVNMSSDEAAWLAADKNRIDVLGCSSESEIEDLEFRANLNGIEAHKMNVQTTNGVVTILALGPCLSTEIDDIVRNLQPL